MNGEVRLQKRHHPDGFVLWDVNLDGRYIGTARQHPRPAPSWSAYYGPRGADLGWFTHRRTAVDALVQEAQK